MRRIALFCSLAALACVSAPAAAQIDPDTTMASPGTRMRVVNGDGVWRAGRFWYLRADTLWLLDPESNGSSAVPLKGGERIEVTRGHRRELWSSGLALLGAVLGVAASQLNGSDGGSNGSAHNASEAVLAGAGGGVLGGLMGWFVAPQRWRAVQRPVVVTPPPPPAPEPAPQPAPADTAAIR